MNIIKCLKSTLIAVMIMSFTCSAFAANDSGFPSRIEQQIKAVEEARKAKGAPIDRGSKA